MNKVFLIGRLTKDIDLKYTSSNKAFARFGLAVDRNYTNSQGERDTDFINIVVYDKQAENMKNYVSKGSLIAIDGRIQIGSYDNKEGKKVYTTDVIAEKVQFLNIKKSEPSKTVKEDNSSKLTDDPFKEFGTSVEITDDDLAF